MALQNEMYRRLLGPGWARVDPARLESAVGGRVVLVTGASSGIGERTAELVAAAGATVLLAARRGDRLAEVAERIAARGGTAVPYPVDLADPESVDRLVAGVLAEHGRVDVVVNNAGKSIRRSLADTVDRFHDVTRTNAVNYLGPVRLLSGLLPGMRAQGNGHVVNVGTLNVDLPLAEWAVYSASKSAFEAWLRCVAPEIRVDGVATTSIHFGLVHTPMSAPTYHPRVPGLTAEAAAEVIGRALVRRPRLLVPWWARPAAALANVAQGPYEAAQARVLRMLRSR
ncbi:short-subunit dehydrogenase [Kribbella amoyensis]|uniref:Short-subunit dehydrogenase n=1 Tax=Kribbella amoyensis TaxID=996641 RepID=A0A561B8U5_9ACTN|nr:SDR family NAD(P)-dependent oxidoreductase [Kribbella amoyensis]TWD75280.1 short-subunit dehydrogenase [Kribbella amoyensis]